jgi:hypothetical protein
MFGDFFVMLRRGISFSAIAALILASAALASPSAAAAQRHGGGAGSGGLGTISRPTGVDEKDSLKDFHDAMAVQATGEQITEFQAVVKSTDAAKAELQAFVSGHGKAAVAADSTPANAGFDRTLASARGQNKKFVDAFSSAQKAGLKETLKRLDKAESDLDQEEKKLDQGIQLTPASAPNTDSLDKALDAFANQQLALGREMGITLASGQDLAFTLPQVKRPVSIGSQTVDVTVSGELTQLSAQNSQRIFKLQLVTGLPEVQQNISGIMRAQLDSSGQCGERIAVRQAMLTPATPASLLVLQLHYERWACRGMTGQTMRSELAESDGRVEMKLTPSLDKSGALQLAADFQRTDASGMMAESLRSGMLGDDLRDKVSQALVAALRAGADFKATLPPAVQNSATLQSVKFQDSGAGVLSVALEGQIQISDEQASQLASQLNQALSAKQTSTQ